MNRRALHCLLLILLAAILLLALPLTALADPPVDGCPDKDSPDGRHSWQPTDDYADQPSCTDPAYHLLICGYCGEEYIDIKDPALGHDWGEWEYVDFGPTCTDSAVQQRYCNRCGDYDYRDVPPLGHTWTDWAPAEPEPTCTDSGEEYRYCTVCNEHEYRSAGPYGHSWDGGVVTTAATCTADGTILYTCSRCGSTYTESTPALGHAPETVSGYAATCAAPGLSDGSRCSRCGTILTAQQELPALGHAPETVSGYAATCTAPGLSDGSRCSRCGTILTAQQELPALGHTWDGGVVTQEPTCTAEGVKTITCTQCGETYTEPVPAAGHLWDYGEVIKEPGYLEEGSILYTCYRDPSHTAIERLPVKTPEGGVNLMSLLRNGGELPGSGNGAELTIVTEPEGGIIEQDGGSVELHIEVTGGTEPYTYEWRRVSDRSPFTGRTAKKVLDNLSITVQERNMKASERAGQLIKNNQTRLGTVQKENHYTALQQEPIDIPGRNLGIVIGGNNPDCTVMEAGRYYCIVTDYYDNTVTSQTVEVSYDLYISLQPRNTNLYGKDSVILTCRAAGGIPLEDGGYIYNWFNEAGTRVSDNPDGTAEVTEEGRYFCTVLDNADGSVSTDMVTVYNAEPLNVEREQGAYYIVPGEETADITMTIHGGVPPYRCEWTKGEEVLDAFTGDDTSTTWTASDTGAYFLTITDALGDMDTDAVSVEYRQLEIAKQPEGGILVQSKTTGETEPITLEIEMTNGEEPFIYTFCCNDEVEYAVSGGSTASYQTTKTGEWYIHVEDAQGRWAKSDKVLIQDYFFRIDHIEVSGPLESLDGSVTLTAVIEGGVEPIDYVWEYIEVDENGEVIGGYGLTRPKEGTNTYEASFPGIYRLLVRDGKESYDIARVAVEYTGELTAPIIIVQPENAILPYDKKAEVYSNTFTCEAVSADGKQSCLTFRWERKWRDGWQKVVLSDANNRLPGVSTVTWEIHPSADNFNDLQGDYYRCIVTDTRTGEETVSQEVYACVEMTPYAVSKYYEPGELYYDAYGRKYHYVELLGGMKPYSYEIYATYHADKETTFERLVYSGKMNYGRKRDKPFYHAFFEYLAPLWQEWYELNENGEYEKASAPIQYRFVITDACGNTFEGEWKE